MRGMMIPGLIGIKLGVLMLALAAGYAICYLANKSEKELRKVGYIVGLFIIATSVFLIVHQALNSLRVLGFMLGMGLR